MKYTFRKKFVKKSSATDPLSPLLGLSITPVKRDLVLLGKGVKVSLQLSGVSYFIKGCGYPFSTKDQDGVMTR